MRQLLNVFVGSLVLLGYFVYESIIYGTVLWYVWNVSLLGTFTTLGTISWIQGVAILIVIKILRFDSSKLNQQTSTPIVLTEDLLKSYSNKKENG